MRVAFFAAECAPLVKVGGLADVVGALPKELVKLGHDVRVFLPNYQAIDSQRFPARPTSISVRVIFNGESVLLRLLETVLPDSTVPVYLIDWPGEFAGEVYPLGQDVNTLRTDEQRFLKYSLSLAAVLQHPFWKPDVVHCHDWHTALVPSLLKHFGAQYRTILTIHNLALQGKWSPAEALSWLDIESAEWPIIDPAGDFNALQHGIRDADAVTTVSPTYAREILSHAFGEGLDEDLRRREVLGVLNGIDQAVFNPSTDRAIPLVYDATSFPEGKAAAKRALQMNSGLPVDPAAPLFAFIGRLTPQKGIDLLLEQLSWISDRGAQVIILGTGLTDIEQAIRHAAAAHLNVRAEIGFDANLAQLIYAGADFLVMPSRFEPCGLGQMIAMRYGTIPIVRDTGGLHDTVIDVRVDPERGTGIQFIEDTPTACRQALEFALDIFADDPRRTALIRRSMAVDHSWYTSAQQYAALYEQVRKA